ncbi:MAG: glycosyltransferase family 4 protein [Verrucomicrobiales bacterium]|nr:glycosyltransferase family 4 protein [Verrucomicrobiales bacterium]
MKAGIVYHQFISDGGLERYLLGLVRALIQRGHEVEVVTARSDDGVAGCGAKVHVLPGGRVKTAGELVAFDDASHDAVGKLGVDVVLGFGRTTRQDVHRAGGGCHKVYSRLLSERRAKREKNLAELELEEKLYMGSGTKSFVVNSKKVRDELREEYGVDDEKIVVVRTPVDAARFSPDRGGDVRARVRRELKVGERANVLLFASREHGRKGLDVLVEAVRGMEVELWVAGAPISLSRRMKAGKNVRYVGDQSDLVDLCRAADWFVHPTKYDACANTVLQSMACGLPGLISVNDGAREFVKEGENGFLLEAPQDAAAVRGAIERALATAPGERAAMGKAARAEVVPLTWEKHVEGWLDILEGLG